MSDVEREVVPDKGRLNTERPVTKAIEFPSCTEKNFLFSFLLLTRIGTEYVMEMIF